VAKKLPPDSQRSANLDYSHRGLVADGEGLDFLLKISFSDVHPLVKGTSKKASHLGQEMFTVKRVEAIKRLVGELSESVKTWVIHCEGGYSRSADVAFALYQLSGYRTDLGYLKEGKSLSYAVDGLPWHMRRLDAAEPANRPKNGPLKTKKTDARQKN